MLKLLPQFKKNLERSLGLKPDKISEMSAGKIDNYIEKRIGKKLTPFVPKDSRLFGRGSVYIHLRRLMGWNYHV